MISTWHEYNSKSKDISNTQQKRELDKKTPGKSIH